MTNETQPANVVSSDAQASPTAAASAQTGAENLRPVGPSKEALARARRRWHRLKMDTSKGRAANLAFALVLIMGGMVVAIAVNSIPNYQVTELAPSGSFFSLAMGGNTIYAASANSGSILLEKSPDRGLTWTTSAVPYSLIASNTSSWTYAAVAVDGQNVVVTASSGGPEEYVGYPEAQHIGGYPETTYVGGCGQNSTILLASSNDGGITWRNQTFVTPDVAVSSIQVGINGNIAAVSWLGETTSSLGPSDCYYNGGFAEVGAVASADGGQTWSQVQNLTPATGAVLDSQNLEMTESTQGIIVAFEESSYKSQSSLLNFWRLDEGSTSALFYQVYGSIPAPSSWTLQGSSGTSAFLLTPTYLIQLGSGGLTGIPFSQLQEDSGNVGSLPQVVSLVASGGNSVEVAATMPSGSGVDCWNVDLSSDEISQTCHVPLGAFLLSSSGDFPIVSLLYGNGWWVAIGAGSTPYGEGGAVPAESSASVGTSVCFTGCQSDEGLVAYFYTENPTITPGVVSVIAALLAALGVVWLLLVARARRFMRKNAASDGTEAASQPASPALAYLCPNYMKSLLVWVIVWIPLSVLAFIPGSTGNDSLLLWAIIGGGIVGTLVAFPFHSRVRKALQSMHKVRTITGSFFGVSADYGAPAFDKAQIATDLARGSWLACFFMLIAVLFAASAGRVDDAIGSMAIGSPELSGAAGALLFLVVVMVVLRAVYHNALASTVGDERAATLSPTDMARPRGSEYLRTRIGSSLLPWNPLVGLIIGWAIQPVTSWNPYFMALAFLPVTLVGIAMLCGFFGETTWTRAAWA